jgi:4-hydroxyphenylpyruvate dioxygenase
MNTVSTNGNGNGFPHFNGFDYVELYTGNAKQAAHFFNTVFGFKPVAYAGLETGWRDRVSIVLRQRDVNLILTAPLTPESEVAAHVLQHGDGVKDVAFNVDDAGKAFETAVKHGATPVMEPVSYEDEGGRITKATIAAFGRTVHSFIQRDGAAQAFLPDFQNLSSKPTDAGSRLGAIDHIAISLERDELDQWVAFYENVLGFRQSHQEDVTTEYSAMRSKVVQSDTGTVVFPMMEPATGKRKSQIEEYLNFHRGPGVQHVALASDDIISSVRTLRSRNIGFLQTPRSYYEMLEERVGPIDPEIKDLSELGILVDRDGWGYLMQVFTEPMQSRPTMFFELIQRLGARGFGGGNIKALFEAVEREQLRRGTALP